MKLNFIADDYNIYMIIPANISNYIKIIHNFANNYNNNNNNNNTFNIDKTWFDNMSLNKNKLVFDYIFIKDNVCYMKGFEIYGTRLYHPEFDSEWLFETFLQIDNYMDCEIIIHTKYI